MVWVVVITFFSGMTPAFSGTRILPTGNVKVYRGDKLVQVLKQESALPDGAILAAEGQCGVRSENLYLAVEDGCIFSVINDLRQKYLRVDKGLIYFALNRNTDKLIFVTPAGLMSTQQVRLNAGTNSEILKGYLDVRPSEVKFGVLEGGSIIVETDQGAEEVKSGKQIILAIADPINKKDEGKGDVSTKDKQTTSKQDKGTAEGKEVATGEKAGGKIPAVYYLGGSVLAGGIVLGIIANQAGGDDSTGPLSPSSP